MSTTTTSFSPKEVAALAERLGVADEVDLDQLRSGMEVELEHGRRDPRTNVTDDDPLLTAKIALAHLRELPDYYTRLATMEGVGEHRQLRVRDLMSLEPGDGPRRCGPDRRRPADARPRGQRPAGGRPRGRARRRAEPLRPTKGNR